MGIFLKFPLDFKYQANDRFKAPVQVERNPVNKTSWRPRLELPAIGLMEGLAPYTHTACRGRCMAWVDESPLQPCVF